MTHLRRLWAWLTALFFPPRPELPAPFWTAEDEAARVPGLVIGPTQEVPMELERKVFSTWAHITRAEDVEGCWIAYCPEFDVVSYGDSPQHAGDMVRDALEMVILDDLRFRLKAYAAASRREAVKALERGGAKLGPQPQAETKASQSTPPASGETGLPGI